MKTRMYHVMLGSAFLVAVFSSAISFAQDRGPAGVVTQEARATERSQRWAVLIGVNRYEDEQGIGSLKYCVADMKLLYEVLIGANGAFERENVLLMTDDASKSIHRPTYSNMVTMIPRWLEDVGPEDDVLIAFSGHGLAEDGQCYLLPGDAKRGALRLTSVSVPQVREWLEGCRADRKVLILDACHSGAGKAPGQMSEELRRELETGHGFLRLASCDTRQKSSEDPKLGHGVFSYHLVAALRGKGDLDGDGRVGADEAYRYVSRKVRGWARERGLRQDPLMSGRVVGGQLTLSYALRSRQERKPVPSGQLVELLIRLDPAHADVLVDGEAAAVRQGGRLAFLRVTPGRHMLEASRDGYARVEKLIDVPASGAERIVRLAPLVTHVTVHLKSGRQIEGELAFEEAGKITIKRGRATFGLTRAQYDRIEKRSVAAWKSTVESPGDESKAQTDFEDVDGWLKTRLLRKVTWNFKDERFGLVMYRLFKSHGINSVKAFDGDRRVTLKLSDVPLTDALTCLATASKTRILIEGKAVIFMGREDTNTDVARLSTENKRIRDALARAVVLDFAETPLADVSAFLSNWTGIKIASCAPSKASVTMCVKDIPLAQALRCIALASGMCVSCQGNMIVFEESNQIRP